MRDEGADAPAVSLPAYADGGRRRVDLGEYVGDRIVVLAFYPADFNPGCTMRDSDLGDLDIFTMQKDVAVFGVSSDSTYSHEAFAERYDLRMPLLSDPDGEAAEAYGVSLERDGERLCERAVFVIDHRGTVRYAWSTDDLEALPDVEPVKEAVGAIGGDDTAVEQYRSGHAVYVEGREAFVEAMTAYEDGEWMGAQNGFEAAESAFAAAVDRLDTAVRFAESGDFEAVAERGEEKADTLGHAAKWLGQSADAYAMGRGRSGQEYKSDAQPLVDAAADLPEPADPDDVSLTDDGAELADSVIVDPDEVDDGYDWRKSADDEPDATLGVDDAQLDAAETADEPAVEGDDGAGRAVVEGDLGVNLAAVEGTLDRPGDGGVDDGSPSAIENDAVEGDLGVDFDAVVEASERDTGATGSGDDRDDAPEGVDADGAKGVDADGAKGVDADGAESHGEDIELELADPATDESDDQRADWNASGR